MARQFRLRQNVALQGALQLTLGSSASQIQFLVERVEAERIPVGAAGGWTRAAVANLVKIVSSLPPAFRVRSARDALRQLVGARGEVVKHPMTKYAPRCIGVVRDQGEALRAGRGIYPRQRR